MSISSIWTYTHVLMTFHLTFMTVDILFFFYYIFLSVYNGIYVMGCRYACMWLGLEEYCCLSGLISLWCVRYCFFFYTLASNELSIWNYSFLILQIFFNSILIVYSLYGTVKKYRNEAILMKWDSMLGENRGFVSILIVSVREFVTEWQ